MEFHEDTSSCDSSLEEIEEQQEIQGQLCGPGKKTKWRPFHHEGNRGPPRGQQEEGEGRKRGGKKSFPKKQPRGGKGQTSPGEAGWTRPSSEDGSAPASSEDGPAPAARGQSHRRGKRQGRHEAWDPTQSSRSDREALANITKQLEFYFSVNNLYGDNHLRQHMDGDGWVHVGLIAQFPMMLDLVSDRPDSDVHQRTIVMAAEESDHIVVSGDRQYLRPTKDPRRWPLPCIYRFW